MKTRIKRFLLNKLHAVEKQSFEVADAIVKNGINGYIDLDFNRLKIEIMDYLSSLKTGEYAYKYAKSRPKACLYGSIYAVMIEGLLGVLENRSEREKKEWADYLNSFQNKDDGLFYDQELKGPAFEHKSQWNEGWGKHHLLGHIIIAFARLGHKPKYPFKFLEKYYDENYLKEWMSKFDFSKDVWSVSNYFMNLYTALEYARDYMDETRASKSIDIIVKWLLDHQNPETGMWHTDQFLSLSKTEKLNVVRGAYHFYPLFAYEGIEIPYSNKIVNTILPLQNSWGGWTIERGNSGACEDIDAIDPLLRCAYSAPEKNIQIKHSIEKSLIWQFACKNLDKGFSFYVCSQQNYGGHELTTSLRNESSSFATWFRLLCIAYEMQFLNIPNCFNLGKFPGYEIRIHYSKVK